MNNLFLKGLKDGIYAVRVIDVRREFNKDKELFCIDTEMIVDLEDYYYYRENITIKLELMKDLKFIKRFFDVCPPMLNKEAVFSTNKKKCAPYDCIFGLIIRDDQYYFYDIKEYRYLFQVEDENENMKPF